MQRVLLITPARDEAPFLANTVRAVAAQTRTPDLWLVVDDGSTDDTPKILRSLAAKVPFLRVLEAPQRAEESGGDRLTLAAEARAFNLGLASVDLAEFTHVGKLDADVELESDYFERLLEEFAAEPQLGIAGGVLLEHAGKKWRTTKIPEYHVRGALKLYSRACFEAIGGIEERLGWDTIDETYARMNGYVTRSIPGLVAKHHRPVATRGGALRGRARHGRCAHVLRYGLPWVTARSFKVATQKPYGLSGVAFLYGYLSARLNAQPKVEDERFKSYVRSELRARARGGMSVFHPLRPD
jgi:hypothetical protein